MGAFNTNVEALKTEGKAIFTEAKNILETMDEFKEWDSVEEIVSNATKINSVILRVVSAIEIAADNLKKDIDDISSGDKLDAAVAILDDALKLPWYLEFVDNIAIKITITLAIDLLNQTDGRKFDTKQALEILKGELFPIVVSTLSK